MNIERLDELISKYPTNKVQHVGDDGKYHYVYKIVFENGFYYIGKHSTHNINDNYFASGKLPNKYRTEGYSFTREVISYEKTSECALFLESCILSNGLIYSPEECLNCYPGSPPSLFGSVVIRKNSKFKMVNRKLVDYYLGIGWELGAPKRIRMTNGNEDKYVLPEYIEEYEKIGYVIGRVNCRDRIFVELDGKFKFILISELSKYEESGWVRRHPHCGTRVLKNDNVLVKVGLVESESLINRGYLPASTVDSLKYIRKDGKFRRVSLDDLPNYLANGWSLGTNICNTVYINDGFREFRVSPGKVEDYIKNKSCTIGRLNFLFLNDGVNEIRLKPSEEAKIPEYISKGYVIGKKVRTNKRKVVKNGEVRYIVDKKLQGYIDRGWEVLH